MKVKLRLTEIGIGTRMAILTTVTILAAISAFVFVSAQVQSRQAIALVKLHTDNLGQSIEHILRFSMGENRREEIRLAIQRLSKSEDFVSISLTNHQGMVVYAAPDSLVGTQIVMTDFRCVGCHAGGLANPVAQLPDDQRFQHLPDHATAQSLIPIHAESSCITCHAHSAGETVLGFIEISLSTQYIQQELRNSHAQLILYSIIFTTLVLIILMYYRHRLISKPVKELIEGAGNVAKGNPEKIVTSGVAELRKLTTAFNEMQTKLQSSQQQLLLSEKLASVGKMAAVVAHEINNPLTGILTFTEALNENADADDVRREDYAVIRRETLRCRKIVRNLLDFTRQDKPELAPTDLMRIIQRTVESIKNQERFANIQFSLTIPELLPILLADPDQIRQVCFNLVINAAEAMPEGGIIDIVTRYIEDQHFVELCIRDTGTGIPESVLPHIFEPLYTTKERQSNGLGLSVTWSIIQQHRGKIDVTSVVGEGTTFQILLPVE
jgi:two-component system, NtrC family, sensor kinase